MSTFIKRFGKDGNYVTLKMSGSDYVVWDGDKLLSVFPHKDKARADTLFAALIQDRMEG